MAQRAVQSMKKMYDLYDKECRRLVKRTIREQAAVELPGSLCSASTDLLLLLLLFMLAAARLSLFVCQSL